MIRVQSTWFESNVHSETSNTITYVVPNLAQLIEFFLQFVSKAQI